MIGRITYSLVVLLLLYSQMAAAGSLPAVAPDFTLKSRQGSNLRLEDFRGQVVLLNFWASWCGPCRQEMPLLEDIYQQYAKLGFTILAVSVDETAALADDFLKSVPVSFPVLYDTDSKVSKLYNIDAMPTTVLIDRDGNQRFLHRGYKPGYEEDYRKQVKILVRE